jgi:hypothetical protein
MATAKVLHPLFERLLPRRAAIALMRVRETVRECGALEKRGERRLLANSHGKREFAKDLLFILRSFAIKARLQQIFSRAQGAQTFCTLKTGDLARAFPEIF